MSKKVVILFSSATSTLATKKAQQSLEFLMTSKKVDAEWIDASQEENKARRDELRAISGKTTLPQVFVDEKFIGMWDDVQALNEAEEFEGVFL